MNSPSPLRLRMREQMCLRNLAANTKESYELQIACMARYCNASPEGLSPEQVRGYLLHQEVERNQAPSTINVLCAALRLFYSDVVDRPDIVAVVPRHRRTQKALPDILSEAEVQRLLGAVENPKHRALLMTVYGSGLRASEVVSLKAKHIDSQRMMIRIDEGKGSKDRFTILPKRLLLELRDYYRKCRPHPWLFPGQNPAEPMNRSTATRVFNHAKKLAGITKGRGIHCLRHCFATHLLDKGVDLLTIKWMLGHSSLRSTMKYLHITAHSLDKIRSPLEAFPLS
mgnify:CR=1 FL=1